MPNCAVDFSPDNESEAFVWENRVPLCHWCGQSFCTSGSRPGGLGLLLCYQGNPMQRFVLTQLTWAESLWWSALLEQHWVGGFRKRSAVTDHLLWASVQKSPRCEAQGFGGKAVGAVGCVELWCVPCERMKHWVISGSSAFNFGKWSFASWGMLCRAPGYLCWSVFLTD